MKYEICFSSSPCHLVPSLQQTATPKLPVSTPQNLFRRSSPHCSKWDSSLPVLRPNTVYHPCCLSFSYSHPNYQKIWSTNPVPALLSSSHPVAATLFQTEVLLSLDYFSGSQLVSLLLYCSSTIYSPCKRPYRFSKPFRCALSA